MREGRGGLLMRGGQRHPGLYTEQPEPLAFGSGAVRSECTMPRPAVIQLTSPGLIGSVPRLSRCMISPSNR